MYVDIVLKKKQDESRCLTAVNFCEDEQNMHLLHIKSKIEACDTTSKNSRKHHLKRLKNVISGYTTRTSVDMTSSKSQTA